MNRLLRHCGRSGGAGALLQKGRAGDLLLCFYLDGAILTVRVRAGDQDIGSTEVMKR